KPRGMIIDVKPKPGKQSPGMGPPPYGYWRITGEPVPDWDQNPAGGPLGGGYSDRASPFTWTFLGPKPISSEYWAYEGNAGGRVISIAPHPVDPNIIYAASASGGLWKTINAGTTWTPLTDELATLNCGAVAVSASSPETIILGTGEYQTGSTGDGIFRSTDGGTTWARIATATQVGPRLNSIAIHPTNPQIIHATGSSGYFRTTNGGGTWTTSISANCSGMRIDPVNPAIVYVARRGNGIYKSTNSGATLTKLTSILPTTGFDRIVIDLCGGTPSTLYAAFISGANVIGVYKTIDSGTTWTLLANVPNFCYSQCGYDAYIAVDPADPNKVFCGGVDSRYRNAGVTRSLDGGITWAEIASNASGLHPDHHVMSFGPTGTIWEGNDGGIWKSTTGGNSWINTNATLAATQMYHVAIHPTTTTRVLAGTQDNGTPERTTNSTTWPQLQAGDGGFSAFDPTTTTRRYTTYVYLTLYRWSNSTSTDISGAWSTDSINWIAPFVVDPNSASTIVAGTDRIWRTTTATATTPTWTAISTAEVGGGSMNAIAIAKGSTNTIYAGSDTGSVFVTQNATAATPTWTNRTAGLSGGGISAIVIHPTLSGTAYVSAYNTTGGRIFRTDNFGANWRIVSGTLTSGVAARALAVDFQFNPPVIYTGGGSGMYVTFDEGATWTKDDNTFPNVNVGGLALDPISRTLTVATYGRGVWRTPLASPPPCFADFNQDGGIDGADIEAFFTAWELGVAAADVNEDGGVDGADIETFFLAWQAGGC
ncbi:MAG: hypothetical protein NTV94_18835, partial [Planctomycetota bacterium]|nr:hypothetical protein [Planctomycetota bacterium]